MSPSPGEKEAGRSLGLSLLYTVREFQANERSVSNKNVSRARGRMADVVFLALYHARRYSNI